MRTVLSLLLLSALPLQAQPAMNLLAEQSRPPELLQPPAQAIVEPPSCTEQREGMLACFVERACLCRYVPGGQFTARPSGYRWDCGITRPSCGVVAAGPPPAAVPEVGVYPPRRPREANIRSD